jgi:hypothetical protein
VHEAENFSHLDAVELNSAFQKFKIGTALACLNLPIQKAKPLLPNADGSSEWIEDIAAAYSRRCWGIKKWPAKVYSSAGSSARKSCGV